MVKKTDSHPLDQVTKVNIIRNIDVVYLVI